MRPTLVAAKDLLAGSEDWLFIRFEGCVVVSARGITAFARMPFAAPSMARDRVSPRTAALALV